MNHIIHTERGEPIVETILNPAPNTLFISNELMCEAKRNILRIPMTFITFAIADGRMYSHFHNESSFVLQSGRPWGNRVVYGAIFQIEDAELHWRSLDAYHLCSLSMLFCNHKRDLHHRVRSLVTPISFSSLDEVSRLLYREREEMEVWMYIGNEQNQKIQCRLNKTNSHRIIDGIDHDSFRTLYKEVTSC